MKNWLMCAAAWGLLCGLCAVAKAGVVFSDDWEQQNVGDHLAELINWGGPASQPGHVGDPNVHTIISENGNKILHVDASLNDQPFLGTLLAFNFQPFLMGNVVSSVFDARLGDSPRGLLDFTLNGPDNYSLQVDSRFDSVSLRKIDGVTGTVTTPASAPFNVGTVFHTYELRSTLLGSGQVTFEAFADGMFLFSHTDTNSLYDSDATVRFQMQFFPRSLGNGVQVDVDNIRVTATPEPASAFLLGLGAVGLLGLGRRKRGLNIVRDLPS